LIEVTYCNQHSIPLEHAYGRQSAHTPAAGHTFVIPSALV